MKIGDRFNPYRMFTGAFIPEGLCKYRGVSPGAKLVYARLCRFAGEHGDCYPSIATLAIETGLGETQCREYAHELIEDNLIESVSQTGAPNTYIFKWHGCFEGEIGDVRKAPPLRFTGDPPTPPVYRRPPLRDTGEVPLRFTGDHIRESSEESHLRESTNTCSPLCDYQTFQHRWNQHRGFKKPPKADREKAELRWSEVQITESELAAALDGYLASDWGREHHHPVLGFLKHPHSWITAAALEEIVATEVSKPPPTAEIAPDAPNGDLRPSVFALQQSDFVGRWNAALGDAHRVDLSTAEKRKLASIILEEPDLFAKFEDVLTRCAKILNNLHDDHRDVDWFTFEGVVLKGKWAGVLRGKYDYLTKPRIENGKHKQELSVTQRAIAKMDEEIRRKNASHT